MKITAINNISQNFKGMLCLDSTVSWAHSGFPNGPDFTDVFVYTKFKDEPPEDLEADRVKLNEIASYTVTSKVDKNAYTILQINSKIHDNEDVNYTHEEFKNKKVSPQLRKRLIDLSEVDVDDLKNIIADIKNNTGKQIVGQFKDGSIQFKHV